MSHLSRESDLAQCREALAQINSEFFLLLKERRALCLKVQELKNPSHNYQHYDPEREKVLFLQLSPDLKNLSIKELLAFSLIMEDQAMAMAPGSYPAWSQKIHLITKSDEIHHQINPLLLKLSKPIIFQKLQLTPEFIFLNQF